MIVSIQFFSPLFQILFEQHTSEERKVAGEHESEGYLCKEEVWIGMQLNTRICIISGRFNV